MRTISANRGCSQRAKGGLKKIFLIAAQKVKSIDYDSSTGSYYNVVIDSDAAFIEYSFSEGTALFEEKIVTKKASKTVKQSIAFALSGLTDSMRESLNEITRAGTSLIAIVVDANDGVRLVGYSDSIGFERPLKIESVVGSSKLSMENLPDESIKLEAISPCKAGVLMDDVFLASR